MPDRRGEAIADEATTPDTPLHAYTEGREEDIAGDKEKLVSDDPQRDHKGNIDDEESSKFGPPAHEKA